MARIIYSVSIEEALMDRVDQIAKWQGHSRSRFIEIELAKGFGKEFGKLVPAFGHPPETKTGDKQ